MTPVFQTTVNNCLSAAVASVLDLAIEDVPYWGELKAEEWLAAIQEWSGSRGYGMCYFDLRERESWPVLDGFHVIVGGPVRRSTEHFHAVVAFARTEKGKTFLQFTHDPYRGGDFLEEADHCLFFIKAPAIYSGPGVPMQPRHPAAAPNSEEKR